MADVGVKGFLDTTDLLNTLTELSGYQVDKDEIAIAIYSIFLEHEHDGEDFIDGKILIENMPYKQSAHGDLRNVARGFLRNSGAFQFEQSFVDILWNRGN